MPLVEFAGILQRQIPPCHLSPELSGAVRQERPLPLAHTAFPGYVAAFFPRQPLPLLSALRFPVSASCHDPSD